MLETKTKIWEKEILEKGKEEGRAEGRAKGKEEGRLEGKEEGRVEGKAEGRAEGIVEGIEKTAINMIKNGETNSKITLYTGLSDKHIEELRDRIKKENLQ